MTAYRVDLDALADLIAEMDVFDGHLERLHAEIDTGLAALHPGWQGAAADEQDLARRLWSGGAADLGAALSALRVIAATAADNYASAVGAGRRMWG